MPTGTSLKVTGLILSGFGYNLNYLGSTCCGYSRFYLSLNLGSFPITLTNLNYSDGCGEVQPITVNGVTWANPLTTPITIGPGDLIEVAIRVCGCLAPGDPNAATIEATYDDPVIGPGLIQSWNVDFMSTDHVASPPLTQSFVNLFPCLDDCKITPEALVYTNPTAVDYPVEIVIGGTATPYTIYVDGVPVTPSIGAATEVTPTFIARANTAHIIEMAWCTDEPSGGAFCLVFVAINCGGPWTSDCVLYIINPVVCGPCGLNTSALKLQTEDDMIDPVTDLHLGGLYTTAAIGEKKKMTWTLQYNYSFQGSDVEVYFNPWLFGDSCDFASKYPGGFINGPPPAAWYAKTSPLWVADGIFHPMILMGAAGNANAQKNFTVSIKVLTDYLAEIVLDFYMIEDVDNWVTTSPLANKPKLQKNHYLNPADFDNSVYSVYNSPRNLCLLAVFVDPKVPIPGTGGAVFSCGHVENIPITARFYDRGLSDGSPEMTNVVWELSRNSIVVDNLSAVGQTKVKFTVKFTGGPIENILFWVFNGGNANNAVDFIQNYDSSRANVATNIPGISTIQNHLKTPTTFAALGGDVYEVTAHVYGMSGGSGPWYIVAIPYSQAGDMVNSFLLGPLEVSPIPGPEDCCAPDIDSITWADYKNPYVDDMTPTIKERIKNVVEVSAGDWGDCLEVWGWDPGDIPFMGFIKKVSLNVYRKAAGFPLGLNIFFMDEQFVSMRNLSFPGNFQNMDSRFTVVDLAGPPRLRMTWEDRVKYDPSTFPSTQVFTSMDPTYMNRIPAGGAAAGYISANSMTGDWSNQNVYFEYVINYDLSSLFGGNPCEFNHVITTQIRPIGIEPSTGTFPVMFKPLVIEGVKGVTSTIINGQFCSSDFDKLVITMESLVAQDGYLVAFLEPVPGGVAGLLEHENSPPLTGMTQLQAIEIFDADPTHVGLKSFFSVDLSLLSAGKYNICGMYLKKLP